MGNVIIRATVAVFRVARSQQSGLFADHYLDHPDRLQVLEEWRQAAGVEETFQQIAQLYAQHAARFNSRTNEAQTEHDFIQPVLNLLWRDQRATEGGKFSNL
jgi:hypothetical protein